MSHAPLELLVSETPAAGLSLSLSGGRLLFSPKQALLVLMGSVWPGLFHLPPQAEMGFPGKVLLRPTFLSAGTHMPSADS